MRPSASYGPANKRQCPLLALSGLFERARYASAIEGKADIPRDSKCQLAAGIPATRSADKGACSRETATSSSHEQLNSIKINFSRWEPVGAPSHCKSPRFAVVGDRRVGYKSDYQDFGGLSDICPRVRR